MWKRVPLRVSASAHGEHPVTFTVEGLDPEDNERYSRLITEAAHEYFKIEEPPREVEGEVPAAYLVDDTYLRVVYDELIVQFDPRVGVAEAIQIIEKAGFRSVGRNCFAENQWIVRHARGIAGEPLLKEAGVFAQFAQVRFAWPNSVAEYHRASTVAPKALRWWLDEIGVNSPPGERALEEDGSGVVVAVLDDGVDIDHPNLLSRVAADLGRDYAFPPNHADFSNPRPKLQETTDEPGDYHGTACAGLVCSDGNRKKFKGVAPGCKLVAVRVIYGGKLVSEAKLAAAIRYATDVADVISCSWVGPKYSDVILALNETTRGRGNKGSIVVCAAGNDGTNVDFPASHDRAIAVGACGPDGEVTSYSNVGKQIHVVAPSSFDDDSKVYSTDVSQEDWGFNPGGVVQGDTTGLFADEVGETSAAAAIVSGVVALCLEANPNLTADDVRAVLQKAADQVGEDDGVKYNAQTDHSPEFGYGCVNAAAAVERAKQTLASPP